MQGFYQKVKNAKSECPTRKIEIKAQACSMSSLGEGQRPMQMRPVTVQHTGVLGQRFKFWDFEGKPLHDQWTWKQKETVGVRR